MYNNIGTNKYYHHCLLVKGHLQQLHYQESYWSLDILNDEGATVKEIMIPLFRPEGCRYKGHSLCVYAQEQSCYDFVRIQNPHSDVFSITPHHVLISEDMILFDTGTGNNRRPLNIPVGKKV